MATPVPPRQPGRVPSSGRMSGAPKEKATKTSTRAVSAKIKEISKKSIARLEKALTEGAHVLLETGEKQSEFANLPNLIEQEKSELESLSNQLNKLREKRGDTKSLTASKAEEFVTLNTQIQAQKQRLSVLQGRYDSLMAIDREAINKQRAQISSCLEPSGGRPPIPGIIGQAKDNYNQLYELYRNSEGATKDYLHDVLHEEYAKIENALKLTKEEESAQDLSNPVYSIAQEKRMVILNFEKPPTELQEAALEKQAPVPAKELPREIKDARRNIDTALAAAKRSPKLAGGHVKLALENYNKIYEAYDKADKADKEQIAVVLREVYPKIVAMAPRLLRSQSELQLLKKPTKKLTAHERERIVQINDKKGAHSQITGENGIKTPPDYIPERSQLADKLYKSEKGRGTRVKLSLFQRLKSKRAGAIAQKIKQIGKDNLKVKADIRAEALAIETKTAAKRARDSRVKAIGSAIAKQRAAVDQAMKAAASVKDHSIRAKLQEVLKKEAEEIHLLSQEKAFLSSLEQETYRKGAELVNKIDHAINNARMQPKLAAAWLTVVIEEGVAGLNALIKKANKEGQPEIAKLLEEKKAYAKSLIDGAKGLMKLSPKEKELNAKVAKLFKGDLKGKALKLTGEEASRLGRLLAKEIIGLYYLQPPKDEAQAKELLEKTSDIEGILAQINLIDDKTIKEKIFSYSVIKPLIDEHGNKQTSLLSQYRDRFSNKEMQVFHEGRAHINALLRKAKKEPKQPVAYSFEIQTAMDKLQDDLITMQKALEFSKEEIENKAEELRDASIVAGRENRKDDEASLQMESDMLELQATMIEQRIKSVADSFSQLQKQITPMQEKTLKLGEEAKGAVDNLRKGKALKEKEIEYLGEAVTKRLAKAAAGQVIDRTELSKFLLTMNTLKLQAPTAFREVLESSGVDRMLATVIIRELGKSLAMDDKDYKEHFEAVLEPLKLFADANDIPVEIPDEFLDDLNNDLFTRLSKAEDKGKVLKEVNYEMYLFGLEPSEELLNKIDQLQTSQFTSTKTDLTAFNKNADELITTSESYVNSLKVLSEYLGSNQYVAKFDEKDQELIRAYKAHLDEHYQIAQEILNLNSEAKDSKGEWNIGILCAGFGPGGVYERFARSVQPLVLIHGRLTNMLKKSDGSTKYSDFNNGIGPQTFGAFAIMPIQRAPRYELLFRDMARNCPNDNFSKSDLRDALNYISFNNICINRNQAVYERVSKS